MSVHAGKIYRILNNKRGKIENSIDFWYTQHNIGQRISTFV